MGSHPIPVPVPLAPWLDEVELSLRRIVGLHEDPKGPSWTVADDRIHLAVGFTSNQELPLGRH